MEGCFWGDVINIREATDIQVLEDSDAPTTQHIVYRHSHSPSISTPDHTIRCLNL